MELSAFEPVPGNEEDRRIRARSKLILDHLAEGFHLVKIAFDFF